MKKCKKCGVEIPPERLEIIKDAKRCVKCTKEKPYREFNYCGVPIDVGFLEASPTYLDEIIYVDYRKVYT